MTIEEFLDHSTATLKQAGVASARLDSLILLEDALGRDRTQLLAHPETKITQETEVILNKKIVQRADHIPLAYIRGRSEFYGRTFLVNQQVLVPRPETETMIDLLKQAVSQQSSITMADIGTGSGAIAVTVKAEFPDTAVIATDIDADALKVARKNAKALNTSIQFFQGNLLGALPRAINNLSVVLANLPYVPEHYSINQAAEHEPKHAIFGGKDGLDLYRRLWEQIAVLSRTPQLVLTESLPPQHNGMRNLAKKAGFIEHRSQDFVQVFGKA